MAKVPARWVAPYNVNLRTIDGPHYDAEGRLIQSNILRPGDTLMIPAHEAFGQTLKWDPTGNTPPLDMGVGHVVLPEHEGLPPQQLAQLGYEFMEPSRNWQPLVAPSRGLVPEAPGEETAPLGTDQAQAQLDALEQLAAASVPETPKAPPTPEELADRAFRRKARKAGAASPAAADPEAEAPQE